MNKKEAIANLNHIYGMVAPDIQRSIDVAIKCMEERPQGEWGKWVITEVRCPECFGWFDASCYSMEELNKCPNCSAKMKGGAE